MPQFHDNLLSINQLTTSNNYNFLLKKDGGYLTKTNCLPHPQSTITKFDKSKTGYQIKLRTITPALPTHAQGVTKQDTLHNLFRKQKPRPNTQNISLRTTCYRSPYYRNKASPPSRGEHQRQKTDGVVHLIPCYDHLPQVPNKKRRKCDTSYSWNLRRV